MAIRTIKPFGKISPGEIKISICDQNPDLVKTFVQIFANINCVEILLGDILNLKADALISPTNSFGDMGGGLDKAIDDFYSGEAQIKVQKYIQEEFYGEMPVGMANILPMNDKQFSFLIMAPTMRIPGNVSLTINAYLALRAILVAVQKYNNQKSQKINHLVLSALCTGVGGMPFQESGEQMLTAIQHISGNHWRQVNHPALAPYPLGAQWIVDKKIGKFRKN